MTITPDSVVVDLAAPDMTPDAWRQSLAGTPAAGDADQSYAMIQQRRGSHAFLRSIFRHESSDGTAGICLKYQTHSPGNTRSVRNGLGWLVDTNKPQTIGGVVLPPSNKGTYAAYQTWPAGFDDVAWRLVDPGYVYAVEGRRTIKQIIERFAPASDGNAPAEYINAVVADMNRLVTPSPSPGPSPGRVIHVALSSGHHNTSGGDAVEIQQTGPLTQAIAKACRALGMEVRTVQGNDGMDMYPGSLSDVAQQVVNWDQSGWPVDVYLEAHTEGAGGARGAFAIYPDWSPDIDADVRDKLGPDIVNRLKDSTGMPIRNVRPPGMDGPRGSMSEKQTGVGAQGYRLGVFRVTEPLRDHTTRLIVEFGAHDNADDLAIFNSPGFLDNAGKAVADSFAAFYGVTPAPQPQDEFWVPGAAFPFVLGFAGHTRRIGAAVDPADPALGALAVFGLPQEAEYLGSDGHTYQRTERYVLEYQPNTAPPFDLIGVIRGHAIPGPAKEGLK